MKRKPIDKIITSGLPQVNSSLGSSPRSGLQEERREQLAKEFSQIDADHNNYLSFEEIYNFLSDRQKEPFDETLCRDLFNSMDKNKDNQISLEEFVDAYTETEDLIIKRIRTVKSEIKKKKDELAKNQEKLRKAQINETTNEFGIMNGSELRVEVKSAQHLAPANAKGTADPFVVLQFKDKKFLTNTIPASLNPSWNESFMFKVTDRTGDLLLFIKNKSFFGEKLIGKVSIPLATLKDQLKIEQFFQLNDENDKKTTGKILLELQWIWSNVRYLSDICKQLEKLIDEEQDRLSMIKEKLDNLRRPFGHLTDLNTRADMIATPGSRTESHEENFAHRFSETMSLKISIVVENEDYLYYSILTYMLLSVVINFARPDFLNVILSIYGFFHWIRFELNELKIFAFLMLASQIFDFAWIYLYAADWAATGGTYEMTVWASCILIFLKMPLSLVFWMKSRVFN